MAAVAAEGGGQSDASNALHTQYFVLRSYVVSVLLRALLCECSRGKTHQRPSLIRPKKRLRLGRHQRHVCSVAVRPCACLPASPPACLPGCLPGCYSTVLPTCKRQTVLGSPLNLVAI